MEKKNMEKLHISPSLLGFGCMRFPLDEKGNIDEKEAEKLLDYAIAQGVTYIDTAYPYHNGDSEPFVGRALKKYPRESYFLATKLPIWNLEKKEDTAKIFAEQLSRLQMEYVDFYLLHALDSTKWEKVLELDVIPYLLQLKKEGKIRYLGFSFHDDYEVFETILNHHDWDFCQIQLNYMDQKHQAGMRGYAMAEKKKIPLVIMEPIKGGKLIHIPEDIQKLYHKVNPDVSMASWALRWVASLPNVKVVLSGMSSMDQLQDNLKTFQNFQIMNQQELQCVEEVSELLRKRVYNGCTGCEYCMPCPFGVDIPKNFAVWNEDGMYGMHEKMQARYDELKKQQAQYCRECGACERMCPQAIQIRQDLKLVAKYYEKNTKNI